MNVVCAVSSEGFDRIKYYTSFRQMLDTDREFRRYVEGQTEVLPPFFRDKVERDLGSLWPWVPEGALRHDPNGYLKSENAYGGIGSLGPRAGVVKST